jgi:transglutaminase-like putative cysteine protease
MKRWFVAVLACAGWVVSGACWSADVEHKRGDFKFFVGDAPAFVVPHQVPAQWDAKSPGVDDNVWRNWLFDRQVDRRGGKVVTYIDTVYEAIAPSNLGEAGKFTIEFNPEYQRLVLQRVAIRRDGAWNDRLLPDKITLARRETDFESDMADGRVTALIVLDDVRVRDVVRVTYTIEGANPILAGHGFDAMATAWRAPMLDNHMRVLFDPGTQVRSHRTLDSTAPVVRDNAEGVEVTVDTHGPAPIVDEGSYPVWFDPNPRTQVGPDRTWADVVAWALPLYPEVKTLPADLEARIAQWKKLPDANARVRAATRAVQDEVRYFGVEMGSSTHRPAAPSETWARRYGDCKDKTYLLATILGRMGIQAVPALVSTELGRSTRDVVPTAAAFNHVIVRAIVDGATVWIDATMSQLGGQPRDRDLSRYGAVLPILAGTAALQDIAAPTKTTRAMRTVETYVPQAKDGTVRLDIETVYEGELADDVRRSLSRSRSDEVLRSRTDYFRRRYGEADAVGGLGTRDDRERNTYVVTESFLLKHPFEDAAKPALEVYGLTLDDASELPRTMSRKGPLLVGSPTAYRHEIRVQMPEGWHPTFSQETEARNSPAFSYTRKLKVDAKFTTLVYDMQITQFDLDAAQATPHLGELRRVRDELSAVLRFQPDQRLDPKARDARLKALLENVDQEGTAQ